LFQPKKRHGRETFLAVLANHCRHTLFARQSRGGARRWRAWRHRSCGWV